VTKDTLDLLREFIAHEVRFLLVGAHAVGYYAEPRATGDLDLLIEPAGDNARRAYAALQAFGAPLLDLSPEDLASPGIVYQMGVAPARIDVLTEISGVSFEEAWRDHPTATLQGLRVPIISYPALVKNKEATGRARDQLDLALLARHRRDKPDR
jgi:hypothetical protein